MLAAEGARIVCADINEESVQETARRITAAGGVGTGLTVDVRSEDDVRAAIEFAVGEFGQIDVLHNNAGGVDRARMMGDREVIGMDYEFWRDSFAVNLDGAFFGCKHALPHMLERGSGSIINTASISALVGETRRPAYAAAKAALVGLTRTIATTYGKAGIRANAIAPGAIRAEGGKGVAPQSLLDMWEESHLTPRLGLPEDIGALVVFLASDESSFLTGQTFVADGGLISHSPFFAQENQERARRESEAHLTTQGR
jgi:NAD(P)-dependent dehydrogenase (short-subunit alcohol dehydrogenase family)